MLKRFIFISIFSIFSLLLVTPVSANNLSISNVTLGERNPSAGTVVVKFDLSWENSWKTKINHDAVWITVRLYNPTVVPTDKKLCQITGSGINPSGTSAGEGTDLEIVVPSDKIGAFIRPVNYEINDVVSVKNVQLTVDYVSSGLESSDEVYAAVYGIEMVYVPEGAFYAGDYDTSTASLDEGSTDSDPWYISSENLLSVSNPIMDGYRYVSAGNTGEDATGTAFSLSASFPKGYGAFYAMKYEITEGQWVDFVNSLPSASARANRDVTDNAHKNSDTVQTRNTVSCSGTPLICTTERPARAMTYLSWMDVAAFLDWAGLRPMTELEYEKMARGPLIPIEGEFAWGTTQISPATTLTSGDEDGEETVTDSGANAVYNNVTLSGGDATNGADYSQGPLRAGIFATTSSTRVSSGAGYYGLMELSGNAAERVVTIGNNSGRSFLGSAGDGRLSTTSGYEGNADESDWPGIDALPERGVTGAEGSGVKGGSWSDASLGAKLRISDRTEAANGAATALNNIGGRGVRTYDEQ